MVRAPFGWTIRIEPLITRDRMCIWAVELRCKWAPKGPTCMQTYTALQNRRDDVARFTLAGFVDGDHMINQSHAAFLPTD